MMAEVYAVAKQWWLEWNHQHAMCPNFEAYRALILAGVVKCFCARVDGELIGYAIFGISVSTHSGVLRAELDTMAFLSGQRGFGSLKFVRQCIDQLLEDGVKEIAMSVTPQRDYSKILLRKGFKLDSTVYALRA